MPRAVKRLSSEASYVVCPKCGNPMRLVNNMWVCFVCGTTLPVSSKNGISKQKPGFIRSLYKRGMIEVTA
ncbi:MAG: hypothetical protein ABWW69_02210 [Pyrodictiaceae archaeon]